MASIFRPPRKRSDDALGVSARDDRVTAGSGRPGRQQPAESDGRDDGTDRSYGARSHQPRLRKLRKCALFSALLTAPLPAVLLVAGLHVSFLIVAGVAAVYVVVWSAINLWTVARMEHDAPEPDGPGDPPSTPLRRHVVAAVAGLVVGLMAPFWLFDQEIEARREAALPANVEAWRQKLTLDDGKLQAQLAAPLPTVEGDPEIVSLREDLDRSRKALVAVRATIPCERDGTCGSGEKGPGDNYQEKVRLRNQLELAVDKQLPDKIGDRTRVVAEQIRADGQSRDMAIERRVAIKRELASPPQWPGRLTAFNDVAVRRWPPALAVFVATVALYFTLDSLLLRALTRRICKGR